MASLELTLKRPNDTKFLRFHPPIVRRTLRQNREGEDAALQGEPKLGLNCYLEYNYLTANGDRLIWQVTPNPEAMIQPPSLTETEVSEIKEKLTSLSRPYIPEEGEKFHGQTINFLMQNWDKLRDTLYPFPPRHSTVPPARFAEVLLEPDKGHRADFIGFGPDGRIFVFEIGTEHKSKKAYNYGEELREVLKKYGIKPTTYVLYHTNGSEPKTLYVRPPYFPGTKHCDKALEYLHEIGRKASQFPLRERWKV